VLPSGHKIGGEVGHSRQAKQENFLFTPIGNPSAPPGFPLEGNHPKNHPDFADF